jgi:hypothetical protein
MVGSSRTVPVDNLLSRFRPTHRESAPLATTVTTSAIASPCAANAGAIVPRHETLQDTRSQRERRARADAGDLQARLDLIPLRDIEDQLSRRFRTAQPDCSILECLNGRDNTLASYQAASAVLEELADSTEQAALTSALVYRYVQAHSLWKGHPDPKVTSAETFLDTLDNSDYVKANIVIGSSADLSKQRSLKVLEDAWGSDWFEKIPTELRDPRWVRAKECSKRLLSQMTTNARRGYRLEKAIDHWTRSMRRRTDEDARREHRISLPRSRYIILDDVRLLNERDPSEDSDTQPARQSAIPDSPKDDRLRVELVSAFAPLSPSSNKPDYSAARPSKTPRKRKRNASEGAMVNSSGNESGEDDNDGWRVVTGGTEMVKRVRNSLIRKPVAITSSEPQSLNLPTPAQQSVTTDKDVSQSSQTHSQLHPSPTCDGPGVALLLRKFIDAFYSMPTLDNDPNADHRCCDLCRPKALRAFKILESVLRPCVKDLEKIQIHRYSDGNVEATQICDISPSRRGMVRKHTSLFVDGSLDDD